MRRPGGYSILLDPGQREPVAERDTITCGHCQAIVTTKPGSAATVYLLFDPQTWRWHEAMGAFCRTCMRPVCLRCHHKGTCTTWERMLEQMEAKAGWWRRFLHLGG